MKIRCGGSISFVAALIIGPRIGKFSRDGQPAKPILGHSVPFAALGGFILMFGFLAFNGGIFCFISLMKWQLIPFFTFKEDATILRQVTK